MTVVIAALLTTGFPLAYYLFGSVALRATARIEAENLAERLETVIIETPDLWKYQTQKHMSILSAMLREHRIIWVRILDEGGRPINGHDDGEWHAWWNRSAPLGTAPMLVGGHRFGTTEIGVSQRELLRYTLLFALFSAVFGVSAAVLAYQLPVRVVARMEGHIDRLIQQLRAANTELAEKAAENSRLYGEARLAYDDLAKMQDALIAYEKMDAVGRIAGSMAHNFRNLLAVILAHSELLRRGLPADSPLVRNATMIKEAVERAGSLINRLLMFSRQETIDRQRMDLNAMLEDSADMVRQILGTNIALEMSLSQDVGSILADRRQLEQVLVNLVINARDAMPGGGHLTIETAVVDAADGPGRARGRYVVLAVRDSGMGMDEQTRSRVFEPFFTTKEAGKGTGLGLSTVYAIVKKHGGDVTVESAPGQGARFTVYLPALDPAPPSPSASPQGVVESPAPSAPT